MDKQMIAGDFTGLATAYAENRPDYSPIVLRALTGLHRKPISKVDFVDVGAGTGIWTSMVTKLGPQSVVAVEPNSDMRATGERMTKHLPIKWREGSAEVTGLQDESCDWVSMASSFHWADFDRATFEFNRILRPGGFLTALWNPRMIEDNPLLVEIEDRLRELKPGIKRVSSGRSGITETLTSKLSQSPFFDQVIYLEGRHQIVMSKERYLGAWRSVNDLRVQLGPETFEEFLNYVENRLREVSQINATYLTRAWSAQKKG